VNNCDDIALRSSACIILEGQDKHELRDVLPPSESTSTVIKAKHSMGRTKCCIVYELFNFGEQTIPLWWEYRVFLVIQVFLRRFSDKSKATAILFKINDRAFNGGSKDIDNLHQDVLQHSMRRPHRAAIWNLDGRALLLNPKISFDVPASVRVVLEKSQASIEHDPIFHRTGPFA
jgi:hypothetical protein